MTTTPCPKCVAKPKAGTIYSLYHCAENETCPKRAADESLIDRASISARALKLRADIQQTFDDAAQWNHTHPQERPIDPDPDGLLARIRDSLDRMLAAEAART